MTPAPATQQQCSSCGRFFPQGDLAQFGDSAVCAGCQPQWTQQLRQGMIPRGVLSPEEFHYAGFWIRAAAILVDILIVATLQFCLQVIVAAFGPMSPAVKTDVELIMVLMDIFYYCFWWTHGGATPGKMVFGLKVIDRRGGPVTLSQAVKRWFGQLLSGFLLGWGFLKAGWMPEKMALHDGLARTRVIYGGGSLREVK